MNRRTWMAMAAVAAIAVVACSPSESPSPSGSEGPSASGAASPGASPNGSPGPSAAITTLRVQLPGPVDGEFAGYVAAQKLGYFSDENLTVNLIPGTRGNQSASFYNPGASGPEFTISPVAPVLAAREHGSDLVDIAQIFQHSGTVVLTWKKDNISDVCGLKGRKVGLWPAPADLELTSSLAACPLVAGKDYTRVDVTDGSIAAFLGHSVDALQGETYQQVAQVLEATNPATNQQYTPDDIVTIGPTDRHATLQDAIFASAAWLAGSGNRDVAVGFVRASIRGWLYCRDHQEDCVQFMTAADSSLGVSHTRWQINEANALVWPSASGVGVLDPVQWQQTITVATGAGLLTKVPSLNAYDTSIVDDAVAILQGKDLNATDYKKSTVLVAPGGK